MNFWAVLAVFAALIFGCCVGFIIATSASRKHVIELTLQCRECSEKLNNLSVEYAEFVKAVHNNSYRTRPMTDYLKDIYVNAESTFDDCEDESDNLYV